MSLLRAFPNIARPNYGVVPSGPLLVEQGHPITNGLSYFRSFSNQLSSKADFITRGSDAGMAFALSGALGSSTPGHGLVAGCANVASSNFEAGLSAGTAVLYVTPDFAPGSSTTRWLFQFSSVDSGHGLMCLRFANNSWFIGWFSAGGGDKRMSFADTGTFAQGTPLTIAFSWSGTTSAAYFNGISRGASVDQTASISTTIGQQLTFGAEANSGGVWAASTYGAVHYSAFWDRALNASEHALLAQDPYCFLTGLESEMPSLFVSSGGSFIPAWAVPGNIIPSGGYAT